MADTIRKDIGIVTAYGYAVSKGYTGTEDEFAQAMANAGTTLESITEAVDEFLSTTVPNAVQSVTDEGTAQVSNVNSAGSSQVQTVTTEGETQVSAVNTAGSTQVTNVTNEGTTQVAAVNSAGNTQVSNVNTAGTTQVSAVQTKGEEVLESIPADYTDLSNEVSVLRNGAEEHYEDITLISGYYIKTGNVYTVDLTPIAYAASQYAIVECSVGDTFVLNGVNSANYDRAWCFVDANNAVITPTAAIGTISDTIVAPSNAVKVIFNDKYPSQGTIKKYIPSFVGINQLADDVAEMENTVDGITQMYDTLNVDGVGFSLVEKAYVDGNTGAFVPYSSSPTWSRTGYIAVDDTANLIVNTTRQGGDNAFYDANKNYISIIQLYVGENKLTVPSNARYAAFSSRTEDMQNMTIRREYIEQAVRESKTSYDANVAYGVTDFGTVYNVGKGKTYETINAAITAWANANYPYATVFIDCGEYKEAVTIESGHQINIIGSGIDSTIIHTTSGNYVDAPITIFHGTVTVKNMTLIADHSENASFDYEAPQYLKAYGIHIDHGQVGGVVTVEKCKIISYQAPAVGAGTIPNSKIRLINCECYSFTDYTSDTSTHQYYQLHNGAIFWHTSAAADYPNRGTESFDMINVKAFNKNDYCVFRFVKNQDADIMNLLAINTTAVKGVETWQNPILGTPTIVDGSKYNNYSKLDY